MPQRARSYSAHVFSGQDIEVTSGANLGDPLCALEELVLGDVYELYPQAPQLELAVSDASPEGGAGDRFLQAGQAGHAIADGSEVGTPGDPVMLEGRLTFMAPDGSRIEMVLITLPEGPDGPALFVLPLEPIEPRVGYTLLTASADPGEVRLSDITPVAFTRGTQVTLADGTQRAVEDLAVGDKVLTRDHGARPLRWIGRRTVRAVGAYAPVVISKGVLSNEHDLIVSQHQRLFIYRRREERAEGAAEILVKARDMVDDDTVFIRRGGFVEYFNLVFDQHEIIYAEFTPTESLLVNEATLGGLPEEMARDMARRLPDLDHRPHFGTEADRALLARLGTGALKRKTRRDTDS